MSMIMPKNIKLPELQSRKMPTYWSLLIILFFGATQPLHGQCVPDPNIPNPGIFPSPIPGGLPGVNYNQVVDVVFKGDTLYLSQFTPIDSIVVTNVCAPTGLTYACDANPNPCVYYPVTLGGFIRTCITLDGSPMDTLGANTSLWMEVEKWVTVLGQPTALEDSLELRFAPQVSRPEPKPGPFAGLTLSSHAGSFKLIGESKFRGPATLQVVNLQGKTIHEYDQHLAGWVDISLNLSDQPPGIYLVRLSGKGQGATWKALKR